ncbi:hypothetical protein [Nocardiopsis sp. CA-288880]|uniref:hypothetical protein n=1 Tax=Nocardiopsis sp. CA-288880 TaxID=3239995 RepID=UPI003D9727EE
MAIQSNTNPSFERPLVTVIISLDSLIGRILVLIVVVGVACALHSQDHGLATSVLLAAAVLGVAADVTARVMPWEAK